MKILIDKVIDWYGVSEESKNECMSSEIIRLYAPFRYMYPSSFYCQLSNGLLVQAVICCCDDEGYPL